MSRWPWRAISSSAVQDKATGQAVTKSITPGQQVVKIVHDELIRVLAGDGPADALKIDNPPAAC